MTILANRSAVADKASREQTSINKAIAHRAVSIAFSERFDEFGASETLEDWMKARFAFRVMCWSNDIDPDDFE